MDELQSGILDNQGRNLIINELHKNLFVIAGAGSGKTTMLVSRMVAMVEAGFDISKICAITFTKKAAAEFLDRFQSKLKERSVLFDKPTSVYPGSLPAPTLESIERCKKALENIDLCFTGTIDSFCNLVLSEYPNNAKIPSSSTVVQDDEVMKLYKNEYEKIANDPNSPLKDKFDAFNLLFTNGAEVFSKSISDVIDVSHLDVVFTRPTKDIKKCFKEKIVDAYYSVIKSDLDIINNLDATDCSDAKPDYASNLEDFKRIHTFLTKEWTIGNINQIKKRIKRSIADLRFNFDPGFSFIEFQKMARNEVYKFNPDGVNMIKFMNDVDAFIYKYAMDFLYSTAKYIREDLKKQGKLTFSEYLLTFRDMVKDDMNHGMKLINHIRNKHCYFLIDESQDTSPIQTELFFLLSSSEKALSMKDCKSIPGSLFIVGDPKQSIYEFRGADVDAYLNTKDLFANVLNPKENQVVNLTKNFRSTKELCVYFNRRFEGFDNYEPIPIDCITIPKVQKKCLSGVYHCATYLNAIEEIVGKQEIFDKKLLGSDLCPDGYRKIEYKDIMILTRTTTRHDIIMKELKEHNLPVYCEGNYYISNNDAIRTIYAIFGYVNNEEGQLFNLLTSPLFNLKPEQLIGFTKDKLTDSRSIELFNSFDNLKDINNPIILYDKIVEHLKLYKYIDFANLEYVYFVGEQLKSAYQNGQIIDAKDAGLFLKEYLSNQIQKCMNLDDSPNAIYLANLHKVKGLERPIVIIVESAKNSNDKPTKYMDNIHQKSYVFKTSPFEFMNTKLYDISAGEELNKEMDVADQKHKEESRRLDYVAVTRARNALIIEQQKTNSVWKDIRFDDIPELPTSEEELTNQVKIAGPFDFDNNVNFNHKRSYEIKRPSKEAKVQSVINNEEADKEIKEESSDSLIKGTIIHRLMEMIVSSNQTADRDSTINKIMNEYCLEDEKYRVMLQGVFDTMKSGGYSQNNGLLSDLLKEIKDAECYTEVPFSFKEGYEIWQGEIDLLYIKNNKYCIIDYKTNADDSGLEEEYKNQLLAYKKAIKKNLGVDSEAYIYHIKA